MMQHDRVVHPTSGDIKDEASGAKALETDCWIRFSSTIMVQIGTQDGPKSVKPLRRRNLSSRKTLINRHPLIPSDQKKGKKEAVCKNSSARNERERCF